MATPADREQGIGLSIIAVHGDHGATLHDGDEVMVDLGDGQARLRDGIYVLRMDDMLSVKRIAPRTAGQARPQF